MVDSALADRALTALVHNPHLPHRTVKLETQEGRVILRGVVRSFYQKQMAQESLRGVEGIHHIENQLQVNWS
jgi:osmotically-inducible protein OsmY